MISRFQYPTECGGYYANILGGMVTFDTVLTSVCGGGSMEIWFTCNGNDTGSDLTINFGP